MTSTFELIIRNGTCVTPAGQQRVDVGINNGKIVHVGDLSSDSAEQSIDATNLHVLPGVIDSQVHFREPGNEHKEDLESGTRAAVLGGVTAIFEMPNTAPPTTSREALQDKLDRASGRAWCDYAFFIGGTPQNSTNWHELEQLPGCSGIKIFMGSSTGDLLVAQDDAIRSILQRSSRRCAIHAEDEARLEDRKSFRVQNDPSSHPIWRDEETAIAATRRILNLARETGHQVHVLHITTRDEMAILPLYRDVATVETTPQHLTLNDEAYKNIGTFAQMNPPIRAQHHVDGLWQGIRDGVVDVIGSDHAPHTREEKARPYPDSPAGMPGVQTLVPVMLNHVNNGKLSLERFVDLTSSGPARIYNIAGKGRIAAGFDADFTLVDMKATAILDDKDMASKCGWTPYHGMKVTGIPTHTIIRGNIVMEDGKLTSENAIGEAVRFTDTMLPK